MHKSKLAGFIIDCETDDLTAPRISGAARSGCRCANCRAEKGEIYKRLDDSQHGLHIEVQKVSHPSRVHLDIETDDIEAEVRRLEKLGAKRIQAVHTWWVMEAPTGQRFCVVRGRLRHRSTATGDRPGPEGPFPTKCCFMSQIGDEFDIVQQIY